MTMTLEQRRAADAWSVSAACDKEFVSIAKSAPALIMTSGLMQTMAFLEDKNQKHHERLAGAMRSWLTKQFPELFTNAPTGTGDPGYDKFMEALLEAQPGDFQAITAETMAWLRWVRQIAPTRQVKGD